MKGSTAAAKAVQSPTAHELLKLNYERAAAQTADVTAAASAAVTP
jgi:hypothetical protein